MSEVGASPVPRALTFARCVLVGLAWTLSIASVAHAQLEATSRTVVSIQIDSALESIELAAREAIVQPIDARYSIEAIRDSLQNLHAMGNIADIRVEAIDTPEGLALVFRLEPLVRLYDVELTGELLWSKSRLRRVLSLQEGEPLDRQSADHQADRLQEALADEGYLLATVEATIRRLELPTRGILSLEAHPRRRTRLRSLAIEGDIGVAPSQARVALGLRPGGAYRPAALEAGLDRLQAMLIDHHYFFATIRVSGQTLDLSDNTMALRIEIDAGPRVDLRLQGLAEPENKLHPILSIFEFGTVDDWALKESRHQLVRYLQDRGHWRPLVSYSRQRDEKGRNVQVQFRVLAGPKARLRRIEFSGNEVLSREDLLAAIRSRESVFMDPVNFVSSFWEEDQRAVVTAYRRRGFRQAEITGTRVRVDPQANGVVASMAVLEGDQTLLADVRLEIETDRPTPGIALTTWARGLEQRPGGPFDPGAVRRDADRLRALLANVGYPRGVVVSEILSADALPVVVYGIRPGARARVARVIIAGNENTREEVIRRELGFVAGAPYSFTDILDTQSRLYRLGIFSQVDVVTTVPDDLGTNRSLVVRVREGPPMFVSYGAGFDTDERLRVLVGIGHNNILGRNLQASLSARASVREQRVRLLLREPYFLGRRLESTVTGFYVTEKEPSFDVQRFGGSFQLLATHSGTLASIGRYSFRDINTFNIRIDPDLIDREDQSTRVGSIGYALIIDTRPDPIEPRSGTYSTLDFDLAAHALGSSTDFATLSARLFWYRGLGRALVLAIGLRAGIKIPYSGTERVPLPERFFAGGSTTLRGFALDQAGPKDSDGNPLGGEVLLMGNLELRFPIRGALGAVVFADIGNVFATPSAVTWNEVRKMGGLGIRYATPVGPIRLDVARLLDHRDGEDQYQLFFSVGHTF